MTTSKRANKRATANCGARGNERARAAIAYLKTTTASERSLAALVNIQQDKVRLAVGDAAREFVKRVCARSHLAAGFLQQRRRRRRVVAFRLDLLAWHVGCYRALQRKIRVSKMPLACRPARRLDADRYAPPPPPPPPSSSSSSSGGARATNPTALAN